MSDFEEAVKLVQPSSKREGFSSIPNIKWEDIGGHDRLRRKFYNYIVNRIKDPLVYQKSGLNFETGFLLHGPPGCGKTLIAKAVANEAGANFIHVMGPELLDKYVGESELKLRTMFRPGRFGEVMYVSLPNQEERGLILKALSKNYSLDADVDLIAIARNKACENLSGADLKKLITKAAKSAYKEKCSKIKTVHFEKALKKVSPSVSDKERQHYDLMAKILKS